MLLQSERTADECRRFLIHQSTLKGGVGIPVRVAHVPIYGPICKDGLIQQTVTERLSLATLHAVLYPSNSFPLAKQFWQHTGMGITSRFAENCLALLFPCEDKAAVMPWTPLPTSSHLVHLEPLGGIHEKQEEYTWKDGMMQHVECAKRVMRRRIAQLERGDTETDGMNVTEDDVYLFPTGMQAICAANALAQVYRFNAKSICFGYASTSSTRLAGRKLRLTEYIIAGSLTLTP
jgi:cystathionine gamma-synthase